MRSVFVALCLVIAIHSPAFALDNQKVSQALKAFDAVLSQEATKLIAARKQQEAEEVLGIQKKINDTIVPLNDPSRCESFRKAAFAKRLVGRWTRPSHPDTYTIEPEGNGVFLKAYGPAGNEVNRGQVTVESDEKAFVRWNSGHQWTIYPAGMRRLAIEEMFGQNHSNDGIILVPR